MSSNYCFQFLTKILGFVPFFLLADYFANSWYALLNRIQKKSKLLIKFKRCTKRGLLIKKNHTKKNTVSAQKYHSLIKMWEDYNVFHWQVLLNCQPSGNKLVQSQIDTHSVGFLLFILWEYISKRNQENYTISGLWTLQPCRSCTIPITLYVSIALVYSFSLPSFLPSHYSQILSPQAKPHSRSSNTRSRQGHNLTDRLLCTREYEYWLWPVANSNVTIHHPTDRLNSFDWRQCVKNTELLIWRLNYYNAWWKSMFFHATLEKAAVALLYLVWSYLFITALTSGKCSLWFLRYYITPYRFILRIAFILRLIETL